MAASELDETMPLNTLPVELFHSHLSKSYLPPVHKHRRRKYYACFKRAIDPRQALRLQHTVQPCLRAKYLHSNTSGMRLTQVSIGSGDDSLMRTKHAIHAVEPPSKFDWTPSDPTLHVTLSSPSHRKPSPLLQNCLRKVQRDLLAMNSEERLRKGNSNCFLDVVSRKKGNADVRDERAKGLLAGRWVRGFL